MNSVAFVPLYQLRQQAKAALDCISGGNESEAQRFLVELTGFDRLELLDRSALELHVPEISDLAKVLGEPHPPKREPGSDLSEVELPHLPGHYHVTATSEDHIERAVLSHCEKKHRRVGKTMSLCESKRGRFLSWAKVATRPVFDGKTITMPSFVAGDVGTKSQLFVCKMWRHRGPCRDYVFHRDYTRILSALKSREAWLYIVVTFDVKRWNAGRQAAWKQGWRALQRLRQRLERALGTQKTANGYVPINKLEYLCVMEQHASGWPHANLLLTWDGLRQLVGFEGEDYGNLEDLARRVERWIKDTAPQVGLGWSIKCSPLQSPEKMANYCSGKSVGNESDAPHDPQVSRIANEVNKQTKEYQVPVQAPPGTRRIRASRGLLPPIRRGDGSRLGAIYNPLAAEEYAGIIKGEPGASRGIRGGVNSPASPAKRGPPALVRGGRRGSGAPPTAPARRAGGSADIEQFTDPSSKRPKYDAPSSFVYRHESQLLESCALVAPCVSAAQRYSVSPF